MFILLYFMNPKQLSLCSAKVQNRSKIYLKNLSSLLHTKQITTPQISLSRKLFPQQTQHKYTKVVGHQRSKSSNPVKLLSCKDQKLSGGAQMRKTWNRNVDLEILPKSTSTQLMGRSIGKLDEYLFHSQSLKRSWQYRNSQGNNLQDSKNSHEFLRKGSQTQKQIVTNLLRNKLIREREKNEKARNTDQEILTMIKVYKGVERAKPREEPSPPPPTHRDIKGWDNEEDEHIQ